MEQTTVARNYAEALFELGKKEGELELYAEQMGQIADVVRSEEDFRLFLETPLIEPSVKKRVVREVFEDHLPQRLLRFLLVVIEKRRARLLPEMAEAFSALVNEHFGRLKVEVMMAEEPDEALKADLKQRLGRLLDREILPHYRINPRIIGGVVVKVGDRIMDGSIRHRLHNLRRSMLRVDAG